jgi:hypothetical protein
LAWGVAREGWILAWGVAREGWILAWPAVGGCDLQPTACGLAA